MIGLQVFMEQGHGHHTGRRDGSRKDDPDDLLPLLAVQRGRWNTTDYVVSTTLSLHIVTRSHPNDGAQSNQYRSIRCYSTKGRRPSTGNQGASCIRGAVEMSYYDNNNCYQFLLLLNNHKTQKQPLSHQPLACNHLQPSPGSLQRSILGECPFVHHHQLGERVWILGSWLLRHNLRRG